MMILKVLHAIYKAQRRDCSQLKMKTIPKCFRCQVNQRNSHDDETKSMTSPKRGRGSKAKALEKGEDKSPSLKIEIGKPRNKERKSDVF